MDTFDEFQEKWVPLAATAQQKGQNYEDYEMKRFILPYYLFV